MTTLKNQAYLINWVDEPGSVDPVADNVDVVVHFEDGSRYTATFFTPENVQLIRARYRESGECADGLYFWASHMILIEHLTWENVARAVADLIESGEFASAFEGPFTDSPESERKP